MNAIDGHEPLPPILPPELVQDEILPDEMKKKTPSVVVQVFLHTEAGTVNVTKSAALPEPNYPIDKAIAFLAAEAAEVICPRTKSKPGKD